eukprot:GGOE01054101.1.p3 GENE.GGOE01054101.1~~GGOE01054101.1.p3  ORF type:complete len:105 (+),score=18.74 GGOE01054101.1:281-595(+)
MVRSYSLKKAAPKKVPLADATNTRAALTTASSAYGMAPLKSETVKAKSPDFAKVSWNTGDYFFPKYSNFGTLQMAADGSGLAANISPPITSVPYEAAFSLWTVV